MKQALCTPFTGYQSFAPFYGAVSYMADGGGQGSGFDATEGLRSQPWAVAGVFSNPVIRLSVPPGVGTSWIFTLMVAGVASSVVVTISGTNTEARDIANTAAIAAGDKLSWRVTATGSPTASSATCVIEFDSTATGESGYGRGPRGYSAATVYVPVFGAGNLGHATAALANEPVAVAGTIVATHLLSWNATPPGSGNASYTLVKNGVLQDGSGGTPNTTVTYGAGITASGTFSLPVSVGDLICYRVVSAGTYYIGQATRFVATTNGESIVGGGTLNTLSTSTNYNAVTGAELSIWQSAVVESSKYLYGGVSEFILDQFHILLHTAPGGVTARTVSGRLNGTNPVGTPSVTIAGSATTGSDPAGVLTVADGDAFNLQHVPTGTPAHGGVRWTFRQTFGVPPTVETLVATGRRSTQARIRGRIDPNGSTMTGRFAWGLEGSPLALDTETVDQAIAVGTIFITFDALLTGLTPETTYYYRAIANDGSSDLFGAILSFTTLGEHEFIDGEVSYPLAWLELTKRDGEMKPFAEVDLNDAPTYYGGYKAPWVKRFHGISRGLSDRDGQIEHLTFGALFADTFRFFRGLLEDAVNKYLTNRPLVERFIDDEDRRIEGLPRIAAVGYVNDYAPREDLQFDLKGSDWLKKKFSRKRRAQQSWQPLITREDFPNCSDDVVNIAAPLIYGSLGLSGADPVENVQITINAQPSAAPGSFALTLVAGGRLAGVRRYYKVAGIVGGQETVQTATLTAVTDNTNKTIRLTWTAVPSATAIYVYSSHRPDFSQFAYTVLAGGATSYDDDTTPPNQDKRWLDATDWLLGLRLNLSYYVYANLGAGVFSRPGVASTFIAPIPYDTWQANGLEQRDIDISYDAHPDETDGYRVVRRRSYYSDWDPRFDRQWDTLTGVLTVTDDAITNTAVDVPAGELVAAAAAGQVQAIPIGRFDFNGTQLNGLLLCRCASARVGKVYVPVTTENVEGETDTTYEPVPESEFGVTWFAPDHTGWLYADKFVDINVRRYTLIGTTVDPLPDKVLVDVDGIETDGDGEGELIRSIVRQRLHFMNNFIAPDTPYASGAYLTAADTTFPHLPTLPLVDEASHEFAEAALEDRLPGGYEGAGIIGAGGEFISATDVLAQFHVSADVDQVFSRKGQDSISAEPIALAVDPPKISDVINIKDGSFSLADQVQNAFFNILPFAHTRDYTGRTPSGWYGVGEERSQTSIDNYDQERESPRFELHFLRSNTIQGAATIVDVMQRKKARYMDPRRSGALAMPFEGLTYEPGDVVEITAVEGIGASGWNGRQVRLIHHNAFPSEGQIVLDFYDLELVLDNQGSP